MDFFKVCHREKQKNVGGERQTVVEIFPAFSVLPSQDLMVRGKEFFAIWDPDIGFWSTDEYRARELIDREVVLLGLHAAGHKARGPHQKRGEGA